MRILLLLAVLAIATGLSLLAIVIDASDAENNDEPDHERLSKRRNRLNLLRRTEEVTAPADPLPSAAMLPSKFAKAPPSDPLPDNMQKDGLSEIAPADFPQINNNLESEMLPIVTPEDRMLDQFKPENAAILAEADLASTTNKKTVTCVLMEAIYLFAPGFEPAEGEEELHQWQCQFHEWQNAILILKGMPPNFYERHQNKITSAETILSITYDAALEDPNFDASNTDTFWIPKGSTLALLDAPEEEKGFRQRRKMAVAPEGNHTLLVVRVSDTFGNRPNNSAAQISDDIFGTGLDAHNLRSQYIACSAGKLDFVPAEGENIVNGVAELIIPKSLKLQFSSVVENWALAHAPDLVGALEQWTLVMFILPDTVKFFVNTAAYTRKGARHSIFKEEFSNILLVLMHEIGHNLGNEHSGIGNAYYDDGTCLMGSHLYDDDAPRMCFNGAKSYYFGWYADAQVDINPKANYWKGKLVGVDDYVTGAIKKDGSQYVVARIPLSTSPDLFLMYNRKKGINSQVVMNGDEVTIVQQDGANAQSWLLAGLSERDEPFRFKDWDGSGTDLIVDVCSQKYGVPDYAEVAIYLDDGTETPLCSPAPGSTLTASYLGKKKTIVELPIMSNENLYREKEDGSVRTSPNVQTVFGENWNMQGFRFESSDESSIPKGVNIESAVILIYPFARSKFMNLEIYGNAIGHAVGDATRTKRASNFISKAPKTAAMSSIGPGVPAWKPDRYEKLVDVTPIVQEIVWRTDYKQGSSIEIFLMGISHGPGRRILTADSGHGPKLLVEFKTAAAGEGSAADDGEEEQQPVTEKMAELGFSKNGEESAAGDSELEFLDNGGERTAGDGAEESQPDIENTDELGMLENGGESEGSESDGGSQAPIEREIKLKVLDKSDDYAETSSGSLRAASKFLWKGSVPMLAYRFQKVTIPKGAKILEANLEVRGRSKSTMSADISGIIQGEDVGNSPPFKYKDRQLTEARKTTATVEVKNLPQWNVNKYNSVGDVTAIVQELVNREDFAEGNAIKLILSNKGSKSSRRVDTSKTGNGAKLFIRYEDTLR